MDLRVENRATRRHAAKELERRRKSWPETLRPIPKEEWGDTSKMRQVPFEVLRSQTFLVQLYEVNSGVDTEVIRMSVNRCAIKHTGHWQDDISWEELQRLKAEAGLGDRDAIEIYPRDFDLVNVANMRHLWILKDYLLPFAWRKGGQK